MSELKPIWKYDDKDVTTWKYIDCRIKYQNEDAIVSWILNPVFKYSHLDTYQNKFYMFKFHKGE